MANDSDPPESSPETPDPAFQLEGLEIADSPVTPEPVTAEPAPPAEPAAPAAEATPFDQVKQFSENVAMEKVQVPAAFPFSLLIEGELSVEEKEKLLDVLAREDMGIREVDLEPQLAGGRILIPRISEYAGILLVQALRGTRARMRLGPSDTIYASSDASPADDPSPRTPPEPKPPRPQDHSVDPSHPAERIAITSDDRLPQLPDFSVIDLVTASATLHPRIVETEPSAEYQELLDNLQRELRYKAYRKGAVGITLFKIQLQPLSLPTQYRLTVSGAAVKPVSRETLAAPSPPLPAD